MGPRPGSHRALRSFFLGAALGFVLVLLLGAAVARAGFDPKNGTEDTPQGIVTPSVRITEAPPTITSSEQIREKQYPSDGMTTGAIPE